MPHRSLQPETNDNSDLLPGQKLILDAGFMESGQSWLLEMPTGSGKTWLSEQAINHVLQQGRKAIYVAPIKALTQNQYTDWAYRFGADNVGILDSDHELNAAEIAAVQLLVTTPESLESCLRQPQTHLMWLRQLSLLVIDEIDLINDGWRGARLEGAILQLQLLNPLLRVIGITATLGDERALRTWLGAAFVRTTHRAVPLDWQQIRFWTAAEKQSRAVQYVLNTVQQQHQCLIFCQSRQRTELLGQVLLEKGIPTLWHHAGLAPVERAEAEDAFQFGKVQVLCATTTLAMGVNLPAREVLIYDTQRPDGNGDFAPMPKRELIQMAGRAGRPGFDERGTVTLLVHEKEVGHWRDVHQSLLLPIRSALADPALLTERVLTAINGQYVRTSAQLQRFLNCTLAAQQDLLPDVPELLQDMQTSGMIAAVEGKFTTTSLSDLAIRYYLQPSTASHFQRLLQVEELWLFDLLLVVCSCPDFAPLLPVRQEQVSQSEVCLASVATVFLQSQETLEEYLRLPQEALLKVVYTACALYTWTVCGDVEETASTLYCAYPQDLLKAIASAQRLLEALLELCTVIELPTTTVDRTEGTTTPTRLEALLKMVTHGFNPEESTLLSVPGVAPAQAKQLIRLGIRSVKQLGQTDPQALVRLQGVGAKTRTKLVRYARVVAKQLPNFSEPCSVDNCQHSVKTLRRLWIKVQTNWNR